MRNYTKRCSRSQWGGANSKQAMKLKKELDDLHKELPNHRRSKSDSKFRKILRNKTHQYNKLIKNNSPVPLPPLLKPRRQPAQRHGWGGAGSNYDRNKERDRIHRDHRKLTHKIVEDDIKDRRSMPPPKSYIRKSHPNYTTKGSFFALTNYAAQLKSKDKKRGFIPNKYQEFFAELIRNGTSPQEAAKKVKLIKRSDRKKSSSIKNK